MPSPSQVKVLTRRSAGRPNRPWPGFTGLPDRIEVPIPLQGVIDRRFYRSLESLCGLFYAGTGTTEGFYGWDLLPWDTGAMNPANRIGQWALQVAFRYAPGPAARAGAIRSIGLMREAVTSLLQRRAIIEALARSGQASWYTAAIATTLPTIRGMLQAGYLETTSRPRGVPPVVGLQRSEDAGVFWTEGSIGGLRQGVIDTWLLPSRPGGHPTADDLSAFIIEAALRGATPGQAQAVATSIVERYNANPGANHALGSYAGIAFAWPVPGSYPPDLAAIPGGRTFVDNLARSGDAAELTATCLRALFR